MDAPRKETEAEVPAQSPKTVVFKGEVFHYAIPDRVLRADLLRVSRRLKAKTLFQQQYTKHGRFVAETYRRRFGTWNAALENAGLLPSAPRGVEDAAMLDDIREVAAKLGVSKLPRDAYTQWGRYSATNIVRRFGRWTRAVQDAGLIATPPVQRDPTREELFENFEQIWASLGHQPRGRHLAPPQSRFSLRTYKRRFGTFRKALAAFLIHQRKIGKTTAVTDSAAIPARHKTTREVRAQLRYQVLRRDHFKCRSCGRSPASDAGVELHIDHIKPWSAGGETVLENLQTLCETCNAGKGGHAA